jgi:hypothetical protein
LALQWTGAGLAGIGFAGAGVWSLGDPPLLHPSTFMMWWASRGPSAGAVSVLALTGLVCSVYWFLLCSAVIVAGWSGRLLRLESIRLPGAGRLAGLAVGTSLAGAAALGVSGCGGATSAGAPAVLSPAAPQGAASAPIRPPELVRLDPARPVLAPAVRPELAPAASPIALPEINPPEVATTPTVASAVTQWTVRPGDDLWSITESVLADRLGRQPDDREVSELWVRVIDVNRSTLADPGNPSLIFAGEVVAVPE